MDRVVDSDTKCATSSGFSPPNQIDGHLPVIVYIELKPDRTACGARDLFHSVVRHGTSDHDSFRGASPAHRRDFAFGIGKHVGRSRREQDWMRHLLTEKFDAGINLRNIHHDARLDAQAAERFAIPTKRELVRRCSAEVLPRSM